MRHLHWKLLVAVFVLALSSAAIGDEDAPDVDDVLGNVDDKLLGIWEWTDEYGSRYLMYLRPDGIAIFNEYDAEDEITYAYVCRYGVSGGYIAMGESTDFWMQEGEWEEDGIDEEFRGVAPYEITDTTLTIVHCSTLTLTCLEEIYTKSTVSTAEILVPDEVILYDGSTSVETQSWGRIKARLAH